MPKSSSTATAETLDHCRTNSLLLPVFMHPCLATLQQHGFSHWTRLSVSQAAGKYEHLLFSASPAQGKALERLFDHHLILSLLQLTNRRFSGWDGRTCTVTTASTSQEAEHTSISSSWNASSLLIFICLSNQQARHTPPRCYELLQQLCCAGL